MEKPDLTGAKVYEVAERPSLGGGQWIVLADDTTYSALPRVHCAGR